MAGMGNLGGGGVQGGGSCDPRVIQLSLLPGWATFQAMVPMTTDVTSSWKTGPLRQIWKHPLAALLGTGPASVLSDKVGRLGLH